MKNSDLDGLVVMVGCALAFGLWGLSPAARCGEESEAETTWRKVAAQPGLDRWPEARFYQALARHALGQEQAAATTFDRLVDQGKAKVARPDAGDFFAKFGEQDTRQTRAAAAHYTLGLGLLERGEVTQARAAFAEAVRLNRSHLWARHYLDELTEENRNDS